MDDARATEIMACVTAAGLAGVPEPDLLRQFCESLVESGLPVSRANILIDTLHPIHEGRAFRWRRGQTDLEPMVEYGRTSEGGAAAEAWQRSPFFRLVETGESMLRRSIAPGTEAEFPLLDELRELGQTDFIALIQRFESRGVIGEMDCIYSSWATDSPGGFSEAEAATLNRLFPPLALALKCASLTRIAATLVETYLGRDAGRRVLDGRIARGVAERIEAVLWFSDLRGFTHISEAVQPDEIIPFLNDYSDAIISSIHDAGGDVLKLMGDGTLAIFKAASPDEACRCALAAETLMRSRIDALNAERAGRGLPVTDAYLGLHIGEVYYGNIGSQDRLDFTVVGPAVNETTRIAALCRSVEKDVLVSWAFAAAASPSCRDRLVSVGRFALKGVKRPQELFTIERESDGEDAPDARD